MKKLVFNVLILVVASLLTASCGEAFMMPSSSGRPY